MSDRVRVSVDGALGYLTLTRAPQHNGVDFPMLEQMLAAQAQLKRRRDLRAVIVHGEGPSFCAGLDFKTVLSEPLKAAWMSLQLYTRAPNKFQRWSVGLRTLGMPVIAAVHGNCFGAGLQLALGADIRICTPDAKLSVMESKWGLVPDMGGIALLRELTRIDIAKELTFSGRVISGLEAHALGLVTHVSDDPVAHARGLAQELEVRSPDALAAAKFLLHQAWTRTEAGALRAERHWQARLIGRKNQRIAMQRNQKKGDAPYVARKIGV
jgi:enoyl-CoA hydratase/carnithine racemase